MFGFVSRQALRQIVREYLEGKSVYEIAKTHKYRPERHPAMMRRAIKLGILTAEHYEERRMQTAIDVP